MRGKFIVIEGIDGCGKTTQIKKISDWLPYSGLIDENLDVIQTREPGGSPFGKLLREIILNKDLDDSPSSLTELLLYAADRAEHISKIITPQLDKKNWVISDRFSDSTLAYQGYGRSINIDIIKQLEFIACQGEKPDATIFLDIKPEDSLKRRQNKIPDRIEEEGLKFLKKVNDGFQIIAKEKNWKIISASQDINSISNEIKSFLINKFS